MTEPTATSDASPGEQAGRWIDRYKLLQPIGEGGMGSVWMAEQREPVVRKVALKIIKLGMDTREVVVRFEAERQALALMEHPHIAKVLDGGATAAGRPYFVMELVKGVPITDYCHQAKLGLRERLRLFTKVCDAIQHAHHKGVIHRDIKPSNVLVTLHDGVPMPKVIDFGIAKATSAELTKKTLFTQYAQILGTPEYMAPEQAEMSGLDIDTRADVYSLGVLLYELLTGTKPFDMRDVLAKGIAELLRMIREVDPAIPSTRVSTVTTAAKVAPPTAAVAADWSRHLRGDLDWIVMKAIEKDRTRRYETPNALAADIERFLRDEPVVAAPPSAMYQFRKFVRRRKTAVVAAALVALSLLGGIVGTSAGMLESRRAAESERLAKEDADRRRAEAETNLSYARKGNEILGSIFSRLDPKQNYETVAELRTAMRDGLGEAVAALDGSSIGDPLEVAKLQGRLGRSLDALGEHAAAAAVFERAYDTYLSKLGKDDDETLSSAGNLATSRLGAGDVEHAVQMLEETFSIQKRKLGADAEATVDSMMQLGNGYLAAGKRAEAAKLYADALPLLESKRGPNTRATIICMANLAAAQAQLGSTNEAVTLYERAVERAKAAFGAEAPETVALYNHLASAYQSSDHRERATPLLEDSLRRLRSKLGADHPTTLSAMNNLAAAYQAENRLADATPILEEVLKVQEAKYGEGHPHSLVATSNLAAVYFQTGKNDLALPLLEKTMRVQKAKLGADHPDVLATMGNLAAAYWRAKRLELSIPLFEELLKLQEAKLGRAHDATQMTVANLGVNYKSARRWADALPLLEETRKELKKNPGLRPMMPDLFEVYLHLGDVDAAAKLLQQVVKDIRRSSPPASTQLATALVKLGQMALETNAFDVAEPLFKEGLEIRRAAAPDGWQTFYCATLLGAARAGRKQFADAESLLVEGAKGLEEREATIPPNAKPRVADAFAKLAAFYEAWDAAEPGKGYAARARPWKDKLEQRAGK